MRLKLFANVSIPNWAASANIWRNMSLSGIFGCFEPKIKLLWETGNIGLDK